MDIRNNAIKLLAMREHTRFELQNKLVLKGFDSTEITDVLTDLENKGLLSDKRFTENYIAMRCKRGFGPIRIQTELCERGVARELAEDFLRIYKQLWPKLAEEVRNKKFGKKIPHDLQEKTKQMRYLYYKGFAADLIRKIFP
jgi:regulatory protein